MKFAHLKAVAGALALSVALAGTAQAQIVGDSSDWDNVDIGVSTVSAGTVHVPGRVGIGVPNTGLTTRIDFQGLQGVLGTDGNGVTTFTATTTDVDDHSTYGRFDYAKVSGADLYFGEWTQTGDVTDGDHTVYYGGTNATASGNVPTNATAVYAVKGISDYQNRGILQGQFNASFTSGGNGSLSGYVQNSGATYRVNIGSAAISGGFISSSNAVASNPTASTNFATGGNVSGRFFGSSAEALAAIVTFGDRQYDTAVGGHRTSLTPN